jgi:hypothetical protein
MKSAPNVFIASLFAVAIFPTTIQAETNVLQKFRLCLQEKRAELEKPFTRSAYQDQGCISDSANDFTGERRTCDRRICWDSPPNHIILSAAVSSHSAGGSNHRFSPVEYLPTRDAATRICNTVHAPKRESRARSRLAKNISGRVHEESYYQRRTGKDRSGVRTQGSVWRRLKPACKSLDETAAPASQSSRSQACTTYIFLGDGAGSTTIGVITLCRILQVC